MIQLRTKLAALHARTAAKLGKKAALLSLSAIACLLFAFGVIAQNVTEGRFFAFDRRILLALRDPINPSAPVGLVWIQETARDLLFISIFLLRRMSPFLRSGGVKVSTEAPAVEARAD
jgi:hypothetical protein